MNGFWTAHPMACMADPCMQPDTTVFKHNICPHLDCFVIGELAPVSDDGMDARLKELGISWNFWLGSGTEKIQKFWAGEMILVTTARKGCYAMIDFPVNRLEKKELPGAPPQE